MLDFRITFCGMRCSISSRRILSLTGTGRSSSATCNTKLGEVIGQMKVAPERPGDDVIDHDLILVWGAQKRIITGSDLLGRLLRGIATVETQKPG